MSVIDHEKIKALGALYEKTGDDWDLHLTLCLTEPTCPTAVVARDCSNAARYRSDKNTIEDSINAAVDMCYRELILGETITPECPFTNPDDRESGK